jgi:type IV pilus assembly protein PilY1
MQKSLYPKSIIIIITFIFVFIFSKSSIAAQLKLSWNPNIESDLAGYKIYYGTQSKTYLKSIDVGNITNYVLTGLIAGRTYFLVATAYNTTYIESDYSNESSAVALEPESLPPAPPPTIVPSPIPEPAPEPAPIPVAEPPKLPRKKEKRINEGGNANSGGQVYVAVSEITPEGPIGNLKKYEITNDTNESTANGTNNSLSNNTNNSTVVKVKVVDATKNPALDSNNQIKDSSKSGWSSSADGKEVNKGGVGEVLLKRDKPRKIITNIDNTNSSNGIRELHELTIENDKITPEMLGLSTEDKAAREKLIQYIHGYDVFAKDNKEKTSLQKRKWILGAIVNSRPLVIPYTKSKSVIYVGANDGMLHAFDVNTGEELWAFIPEELLERLKELTQANDIKYFVDGSPKAYITNSRKIIVFGLRRGGNHYYALDVTDSESPKFLWKIGPETTGFSEMGQTWSEPQFGKIKDGKNGKAVCIIGGGYDENQDKKIPGDDKKGRAVYVVDLLTGQQVWRWDFKKDPSMRHSIPSNVARVDVDGDGFIDRLYVGDMGGKLWRFDLKGTDSNSWSGRTVFNSNLGYTGSVKKKVFNAPDVTLEKGHQIVYFGTGDRERPNEKTSDDKFYAFIDKGKDTTLSENNLTDVTKELATVENLANKEGWFISLEDRGEKVLAPPVVAFGVVYFSTFTPSSEGEGIARVYALNYRVGNPILNLNTENDNGKPTLDLSDRSKIIGAGIPSGMIFSAIRGRPIAYTGFPGGLYNTPLKGHSTVIPISWKEVAVKNK